MSSLQGLQSLHLKDNSSLSDITALASCPKLTRLALEGKGALRGIPWDNLEITHLTLDLSAVADGIDQMEKLKKLKVLHLRDQRSLRQLPIDLTRFTELEELTLEKTQLQSLPALPTSLVRLHLIDNDNLASFQIPSGLTSLTVLGSPAFKLNDLPALKGLTHFAFNQAIDDLDASGNPVLAQRCPELIELTLRDDPRQRMPSLKGLKLETLRLIHLDKLEDLNFLADLSIKTLHLERGFSLSSECFQSISSQKSITSLTLKASRVQSLDLSQHQLKRLYLESNDLLETVAFPVEIPELVLRNNDRLSPDHAHLPATETFVWAGRGDLGLKIHPKVEWVAFRTQSEDGMRPSKENLVELDLTYAQKGWPPKNLKKIGLKGSQDHSDLTALEEAVITNFTVATRLPKTRILKLKHQTTRR